MKWSGQRLQSTGADKGARGARAYDKMVLIISANSAASGALVVACTETEEMAAVGLIAMTGSFVYQYMWCMVLRSVKIKRGAAGGHFILFPVVFTQSIF